MDYALNVIYVSSDYLKDNNLDINNKQHYIDHILSNDLKKYIDVTKVLLHLDTSTFFNDKCNDFSYYNNTYLFAQINEVSNIAVAKESSIEYDNLDVDKNEDNDYLGGEDAPQYNTNINKYCWKFSFTDGVKEFFGFEYKSLGMDLTNFLKKNDVSDKYYKVLIGPSFMVRYGIIMLTSQNFKFLNKMNL